MLVEHLGLTPRVRYVSSGRAGVEPVVERARRTPPDHFGDVAGVTEVRAHPRFAPAQEDLRVTA